MTYNNILSRDWRQVVLNSDKPVIRANDFLRNHGLVKKFHFASVMNSHCEKEYRLEQYLISGKKQIVYKTKTLSYILDRLDEYLKDTYKIDRDIDFENDIISL